MWTKIMVGVVILWIVAILVTICAAHKLYTNASDEKLRLRYTQLTLAPCMGMTLFTFWLFGVWASIACPVCGCMS